MTNQSGRFIDDQQSGVFVEDVEQVFQTRGDFNHETHETHERRLEPERLDAFLDLNNKDTKTRSITTKHAKEKLSTLNIQLSTKPMLIDFHILHSSFFILHLN